MRRNSRMNTGIVALLLAVCVCVAGCGGEFTGGNRGVSDSAVSGSAVSGGAVSGNAVRSDEAEDKKDSRKTIQNEAQKYRYSTDTNFYYEDYNNKNEYCIVQVRLDGSHKEEVVNVWEYDGDLYLHYVDEDWLYYEIESDEGSVLYRVPLEKDSEGYDVVKTSEEEELIREAGIVSSLWSSQDVMFDNAEDKIIWYDLQNKKILSEWNYEDLGVSDEFELFRLKDSYVALTKEGVCAIDVNGSQWKKCNGKCDWEIEGSVVQTENSLFYVEGKEDDVISAKIQVRRYDGEIVQIRKYDGETVQTFTTQEQMIQAAKRARYMKAQSQIDEYIFDEMYVQGDRLYIQLELRWSEDGVYRMEYVLFSQGENEAELRYEKELTECMQSHVKSRKGKLESTIPEKPILEKNVVANDAKCVVMLNGKAYLSLYDYEKDKGRMGCYELSTGKFRWVTKKEALYGELGRSGIDSDLECVFETGNAYVGFWGRGDFVETEK